MLPLFNVLDGKGALKTSDLVIQGLPLLGKIADAIKLEQLRNPTLDSLRASVQIKAGRVQVNPFTVRAGRSALQVAGSHGFDQSLQYTLGLRVARADAEQRVAAQRHPLLAKIPLVHLPAPAPIQPRHDRRRLGVERRGFRRGRLREDGGRVQCGRGDEKANGVHGVFSLEPRERQVEQEILRFELENVVRVHCHRKINGAARDGRAHVRGIREVEPEQAQEASHARLVDLDLVVEVVEKRRGLGVEPYVPHPMRVVDRALVKVPEGEAALERTRLLGSPAAAGLGEAVFRMEAERPVPVVARLLEHKLDGPVTLQTESGPRTIQLRGKADRLDLLSDGTFRLIDYKLGWPPDRVRALQGAVMRFQVWQRSLRSPAAVPPRHRPHQPASARPRGR